MRLIINGEDLEVSKAETLLELLGELSIEPERVAVEVNLSIIKKSSKWGQRPLRNSRLSCLTVRKNLGLPSLSIASSKQRNIVIDAVSFKDVRP